MTTEQIEEQLDEELDIDAHLAEEWERIRSDEEPETKPVDRDQQGRFAAKSEEKEVSTETPPDEQQEQPAIKAPSSWKKELQEKFGTLPPEVQAEVNRREEDFHRGIAQYKQAADWASQFAPIANDLGYLKQSYGNEVQAIGELVKLERFANSDPIGFIKHFAQSRGIPLDGSLPQQDPTISALRQQVEQLTGYVQNERMTKEQREQQEALQHIEQFRQSPEAAHFDVLRNDMAALLQAGLANDIKSAYEKALWQRPDLRQSLISQQIAAEQEKARNEAKNKADAAKKASAVNISKRGQLPTKQADDNLDDILAREAERLGFI